MRLNTIIAVSALALAGVAPLARAQDVVDQFQFCGECRADLRSMMVQSFTPTANTISGAGAFLFAVPLGEQQGIRTGSLTVDLFSALPTGSATSLASASADFSTAGLFYVGFVDAFFSQPVNINAGQLYFLRYTMTSDDFEGGLGTVGADQDHDFYTGGESYADFDGLLSYDYVFGYSGDMQFEEFAQDPNISATPEPASLLLLGTGLLGVGAVARRRRQD